MIEENIREETLVSNEKIEKSVELVKEGKSKVIQTEVFNAEKTSQEIILEGNVWWKGKIKLINEKLTLVKCMLKKIEGQVGGFVSENINFESLEEILGVITTKESEVKNHKELKFIMRNIKKLKDKLNLLKI